LILRAANNSIVWLSPGYSPKIYDSDALQYYRNELEPKLNGIGIFGDEHFSAANKYFPTWKFYCPHTTKGRRIGDSNIPKLLSNEKKTWNNKQKEARAVVEQDFAALKQKWQCLCSLFQEGILVLDQVVRAAAANT